MHKHLLRLQIRAVYCPFKHLNHNIFFCNFAICTLWANQLFTHQALIVTDNKDLFQDIPSTQTSYQSKIVQTLV
jgi:hypothetical protein